MSRNTTTKSNVTSTVEADAPASNVELVASYVGASDRKAKAALRKQAADALTASIKALDMSAASYWQTTIENLVSPSSAAPRVELDPAQVVADRIANLRAAADLLAFGDVTPAGLDCSGVDYANLPEGSSDNDTATKLASAKITRSGERHSIREVIERAFDGQPVGTTLRISEVAHAGSTEDYRPSQGAIAAHFGEDKSIDGYRLLDADGEGNPRRIVSE